MENKEIAIPLYSYICKNCTAVFEEFAVMKDSSKKQPCPECKRMCNKIFTSPMLKTSKHYDGLRGTNLTDIGKCNWLRADRDGTLQKRLEEPYIRDGVKYKDFTKVIERNRG